MTHSIDGIPPAPVCKCSPQDVHDYGPCGEHCYSVTHLVERERSYREDDFYRRSLQFARNIQYGKFASGDPRVDSSKWTGLKPRVPLRVYWFRFRMWFCQDCQACGGDGRVMMMQTGMSEYSDVECDVCHGRRTRFTWPRAVAYYGFWPFMLLGRLQVALWERALQWRYGPCPVCKGSGRERLGVPYVELPVVCSMCEGAGHRLAHDRMMGSLVKGYDV